MSKTACINPCLEGKTDEEISEPLTFEILEKIFANIFALSEAEEKTLSPLNGVSITNLPLLRTILAAHQKL